LTNQLKEKSNALEQEEHNSDVAEKLLKRQVRELTNQVQAMKAAAAQVAEEKANHESDASKAVTCSSTLLPSSTQALGKKVFVTMAYDEPGKFEFLWQTLALARSLQRHSSHPLVVLTNTTVLPDGQATADAFRRLNAHVLPVQQVELPEDFDQSEYSSWRVALWKMQVWGLTQFEQVVWMDSDALTMRSLDFMFSLDWMWAQRDDWFCEMQQPKVCSGMLLLYPNAADLLGLQAHAKSKNKWTHGDQELIASYFEARNKPINLLSDDDASFGQCIGKTPSLYYNQDGTPVPGLWGTPAFVHKSGGWGGANDEFSNVCFSHVVWRQYQAIGTVVINVCHMNPLGAYWREIFCEAVHGIGLRSTEANAFCDDGCWYRGEPSPGLDLGDLDPARWCRPLVAAVGLDHAAGLPVYRDEELE